MRTEYVYVLPPEHYLQGYEEPELHGDRTRDLLNWAQDEQEVRRLHESDKQALREWRREMGGAE